jgi:hypothetical protein
MSFQCRYKPMGLKECAETPGLYACSPCREVAAVERQETTAVEAGPLGKLRDMSAEECEKLIGEMSRALSKRTPLQEYIAKIERDILQSTGLPASALTGTPAASGMCFDGAPLWRRAYMGQWTALEAEERLQRRDDHVDALRYALTGRACGKYESAISGGCDKPAGHDGYCSGPTKGFAEIHGYDRGMPIYDFPCECGRTIRGTDRDRGKRCEHDRAHLHCGGCDMIHEADAAFVLGQPCPMCAWPLVAAGMPDAYNPSAAEVERAVERIKAATGSKPPTLHECPHAKESGHPWGNG